MATGAPGTNGVWQYGEDDSEATFSALLNKAASTTDTQIGADRTRLTALEARKLSGLVPIIPTSVSINAGSSSFNSTTGEITFTGGTTLTINGIFSSAYANYKIFWEVGSCSNSADVYAQLNNSGGTLGSGYLWSYVSINNSSAVSGTYSAGQGFWNVGRVQSGNAAYIQMDICNPYTAKTKHFTSLSKDVVISRYNSGDNGSTTLYPNLLIFPNGQTITNGKCKVYGYN